MFRKGRRDLLEQILRQPSKSVSSPSVAPNLTSSQLQGEEKARMDNNVDSLLQGQRLCFYQIKDIERRMDFFERELGSCRYIVESQSRLIKDILDALPEESKNIRLTLRNIICWLVY